MGHRDKTLAQAGLKGNLYGFVKNAVPDVFFKEVLIALKEALNQAGYCHGTLHYSIYDPTANMKYPCYWMSIYIRIDADYKAQGYASRSALLAKHEKAIRITAANVLKKKKHVVAWRSTANGGSSTFGYINTANRVEMGVELNMVTSGDMMSPVAVKSERYLKVSLHEEALCKGHPVYKDYDLAR